LLVGIGLISYPLYLWHWVLLSYLRILKPVPDGIEIVAAVILSLGLAFLTYRYIERPIRTGALGKGLSTSGALAGGICMVLAAGLLTYKAGGLPNREVAHINHDKASGSAGGYGSNVVYGCAALNNDELKQSAYCVRDGRSAVRYALIGDSKAGALLPGLIRTSNTDGRWLYIGGTAHDTAPVPVLSESPVFAQYQRVARAAIEVLAKDNAIEVVVVAVAARTLFDLNTDYTLEDLPRSPHYAAAYDGLLLGVNALVAAGKKVVLVMDHPTLPYPEHCLERRTSSEAINEVLRLPQTITRCSIKLDQHEALSAQYRQLILKVAAGVPNVSVFDTVPYVCDMDERVCRAFKEGRLLYGVTDHLSDYASGLVGRGLNSVVAKASSPSIGVVGYSPVNLRERAP